MTNGRQSGLVFGAVFKTVRRLLKPLVCSIRMYLRHCNVLKQNHLYVAYFSGDI
jgi:hypothetical protein